MGKPFLTCNFIDSFWFPCNSRIGDNSFQTTHRTVQIFCGDAKKCSVGSTIVYSNENIYALCKCYILLLQLLFNLYIITRPKQ